ncbi:MAG: Long-chain-fatty-acid--CoA ligase FadD17 [Spirochaetes bacterium ADurb.Bin218]|mgnify:FL=1|jgi:acyl-CoA synthetase (AMP-forming)/AMP-acid ligase II|nr:MAG: Long-chain-fatty-acid--CoA ligase FadD17 [Spirochaetes bacterium ADurb.Bin218]HPX91627.1 long-chain-acyl-CoA synthetase [Spirochaetota bacterium]HRS63386.1 long-chain-acyl-CoA synthetase [Spirochaetota bacterium]HRU65944.1 long-chain-acyl-CoA synthetase [Spirochaetota bacterium]
MEKLKRLISHFEGMIGFVRLKNLQNMSLGSVLEKQVVKYKDKPLILFENRTISYCEFNISANKIANFFLNKNFIKGDTVALFMDNRPEFLIIHAGLAKIGVVPALLNSNLKGHVLLHAINIAEAKAIIIGHELVGEIAKIKKDIKLQKPGLFLVDCEGQNIRLPTGFIDFAPLLTQESGENPPTTEKINSKDTLEYIYTSGTTGMPKATELKHQKWLQLGYGAGGFSLRAIEDDVQYLCLPLYHNSGINIAWPTTLMHGGTLAIRRKFSATNFWDDIRKYNASIFIYIGELCRYLNNQPKKENDALNPLRFILGNGMRADYWMDFKNRFGIEKIIEVYGATEGVGALSNLKGVPGMIGRLKAAGIRMGEVVKYDIEKEEILRDANGFAIKCKPGETGLFLAAINNTNPFAGYKNNKNATNSKIVENVFKKGDKYFNSGDLFRLHKGDYVSFVDRLGDTFKWKGEVVATNEVADVLSRFGSFEDCNVYGVTVKNTEGRAGMAALTLLPGFKLELPEFSKYVVENLPVYARPYFIRLRKEKDATTSFKQIKSHLQKEGFDPKIIKDPLYFLDPVKLKYIKLNQKVYEDIQSGKYRF